MEGLLEAGLLAGLAASWLGLLGRWHWVLDLCSHFRWQGLVAALVAVVWAGWRRRRWVLRAALLTLALNLWLMGRPGMTGGMGKPAAGFQVRVVSFNVLTTNRNHAGVLHWLQQSDADLIFLMEVDGTWAKSLQPLRKTHPWHLIQPSSDNFGLALYSRLPPAQLKILGAADLGVKGEDSLAPTDSVEARFETAGHPWLFVGTHPVPPMGRDYAVSRDRQLSALSGYLAGTGLPVLVAGDLNASPWSHGFRQLNAGNRLLPAPDAWKPTWRASSLLGIPLDHALVSLPLQVESRWIGPDLGSDHRPQIIELRWLE